MVIDVIHAERIGDYISTALGVVETLAGVIVVGTSIVIGIGGAGLSLTGEGAIVGVPAIAVSAEGALAGLSLIGVGYGTGLRSSGNIRKSQAKYDEVISRSNADESLQKNVGNVESKVNHTVKDSIEGSGTSEKIFTDNQFDDAGNLKPDVKYQTGEFNYNYETDANGRISNWNTDNLQLTERESRLSYNSDTPGKLDGDHAGHLAGDRFGGSPELDNLVSQSQNVNLSQYKKIENQWANAINEGKEVTVNVDIKYDGDSLRPIEFNVEYTIDGDFFSQSILN